MTGPVQLRPGPLQGWLAGAPPCLALADLPTRVDRASWLDSHAAQVWIKRDDLSSKLYGGSKVRKLEWSLASPPFNGTDTITSVGGTGSNHLVALGLYLREMGRGLHAVVFDQPLTEHTHHNLAVLASIGASFWSVRSRWELPLCWVRFHAKRRPELGTYMAPGGSSPIACYGFIAAAFELAKQIAAGELAHPETIFITGGSAGASGGLALGLALAGIRTHLRIVSAVEPVLLNRALFTAKLHAVRRQLRADGLRERGGVRALLDRAGVTWSIDHDHVGACYGAPTPEGQAARRLAREHGVSLDPTYTSKCLAALQHSDARGPTLFWNTHAANDLAPIIQPGWESRLPERLRRYLATGADHTAFAAAQ